MNVYFLPVVDTFKEVDTDYIPKRNITEQLMHHGSKVMRPFSGSEDNKSELLEKTKNAFWTMIHGIKALSNLYISDQEPKNENFRLEGQGTYFWKDRSLSLLTWNVACNNASAYNYLKLPIDRIGAIANTILSRNPDVILLQEMLHNSTRKMLVQLLAKHGYHLYWNRFSGLFTASKFPIIAGEFAHFKQSKGITNNNKGYLLTHLKPSDGESMTIVNTHLHASCKESRQNQIEGINFLATETLRQYGKSTSYFGVIVGGDFNESPVDENGRESTIWPEVKNIMTEKGRNPLWEKYKMEKMPGTWLGAKRKPIPGNTLDQFLCYPTEAFKWGYQDVNVHNPKDRLSDHCFVHLALKREKI